MGAASCGYVRVAVPAAACTKRCWLQLLGRCCWWIAWQGVTSKLDAQSHSGGACKEQERAWRKARILWAAVVQFYSR